MNYRTLTARESAEIILNAKNPTVVMHRRPDGDTVGSASALLCVFSLLGKNANYACSDPIPERLRFLIDEDKATECFDGREVITIDVATPDQLGELKDKIGQPILMIDHHAVGTRFADGYVLPDASSASEVLMSIIDELIDMGKITLTKELAYPLYASMSSDTGGFIYSNASAATYRRAAMLIECGIDSADINHRLFNSKSEKQIKAEGYIASVMRTAMDGRLAYATLTKRERDELGIESEYFETAIDVVRSLLGAQIALFVRENDNGSIRASLRSTGSDVAAIAAKFNGGGHIRAAGCSPDAKTPEEAANMIIEEIIKNKI